MAQLLMVFIPLAQSRFKVRHVTYKTQTHSEALPGNMLSGVFVSVYVGVVYLDLFF